MAIETKEQYEEARSKSNSTVADCVETIEALREVARAAHELREAMAYNKGAGETKKRLENAYGELWRAKNALPDWLTDG